LNVLFVCIGNQGRSVIAEQLFRRAVPDHATRSAGSAPGRETHREALDALAEIGIDASDHVPHKLDDSDLEWADVVVATCDDSCPVVPEKRYVHWHLPDPAGQPIERVREIRDEIARRVDELQAELG
jgi:arsenate reductase